MPDDGCRTSDARDHGSGRVSDVGPRASALRHRSSRIPGTPEPRSSLMTSPVDPDVAPPESPIDEVADALFQAEAATVLRRPCATYRLQLHQGFRLDDVAAIVDYLGDLGIT